MQVRICHSKLFKNRYIVALCKLSVKLRAWLLTTIQQQRLSFFMGIVQFREEECSLFWLCLCELQVQWSENEIQVQDYFGLSSSYISSLLCNVLNVNSPHHPNNKRSWLLLVWCEDFVMLTKISVFYHPQRWSTIPYGPGCFHQFLTV